eukprot:12295453-Karenia_brevis.AAC.1
MDDLYKCVLCDAKDAISSVSILGHIVSNTFARFAFLPNFGAGKTECVVSLCGPGARCAKSELFGKLDGQVDFAGYPWKNGLPTAYVM